VICGSSNSVVLLYFIQR